MSKKKKVDEKPAKPAVTRGRQAGGGLAAKKAPVKSEKPTVAAAPPSPLSSRPNFGRGLVTIYTYKLAEAPPERVAFSRCMVRFLGFTPAKANPELIWGIHGNASLRSAQAYAGIDAQFRGLRTFRLELNYKLPKVTGLRASVTDEIAKETGYLHCMRLSAAYKGSLRKRMVGWLQADRDPDVARLARAKFEDLIEQRPMLIHRLMAEDTFLNMVIHPVLLNGGVSLSVGTVRNRPELIDGVNAGVHTEIEVTV